ncbi:VCBS repeat-containing protein [Phycisphaeraceae bacterium D3-23]
MNDLADPAPRKTVGPSRPTRLPYAGGGWRACLVAAILTSAMLAGCSGDEPEADTTPDQATDTGTEADPSVPLSPAGEDDGQAVSTDHISGELVSLDPREDGWQTEYFNQAGGRVLKELGKLIENHDAADPGRLARLLTQSAEAGPLVFDAPLVYSDGRRQVWQLGALSENDVPVGTRHQGAPGIAEAMHGLLSGFDAGAHLHTKFKIIRVTLEGRRARTVQYAHVSGPSQGGHAEINATWTIDWDWPDTDQPPRIARIEMSDFERVAFSDSAVFSDCTRSAFADEGELFERQLGVGIGGWVRQIEGYLGPVQSGMNGVAVGDLNGDGLEDLYVCQTSGLPNRLLLHQPDGTVRDAAAEAGVDFLDQTYSALSIDADNDGDQDLLLALAKRIVVLRNDGAGRFEVVHEVPGVVQPHSLAAADYDLDGDLDVYVCGYNPGGQSAGEFPIPMPIYDARNGGRNALLRNEGELRYIDVTDRVGLGLDNSRFSYAAVWEDYDQDGDADLYVVNDFGVNNLYQNNGARGFEEVTTAVGMGSGTFGMSAAAADYNRDGWVDFYKASMFSSAGNRVTTQARFMPEASAAHRDRMLALAQGNTLYRNREGRFTDEGIGAGVAMGRWSWGSVFIDMNNDGWEDLFVANGFITGENLDDL